GLAHGAQEGAVGNGRREGQKHSESHRTPPVELSGRLSCAAMTGKTVLITGASAGIGKATASELAARGARLARLCRDARKGEAARAEILTRPPAATLDIVPLDLRDLASVRACARAVLDAYPRIDVLVNNAGVFPPKLRKTADGFEEQIGVNHLGHFLLTNLLL